MKRNTSWPKGKLLLLLIAIATSQTSCYTAYHAFNTNSSTPIYLHTKGSEAFSFYLDGVKVDPVFTLYKSTLVSSSSSTDYTTGIKTTTNVVERTSIPAIQTKANAAYKTLRVVKNATGESQNFLLRRNTAEGFKVIMYFQGLFTFGLGNLVDFAANSIYGWPEITLD